MLTLTRLQLEQGGYRSSWMSFGLTLSCSCDSQLSYAPHHVLRSSLRASQESIVLLANNASVLPFDQSKHLRYAVIGPYANLTTIMMGGKGDYHPSFIVSILQGLADRNVTTSYAPGTNITEAIPGGAAAAVDLAKQNDFVILTLGLSPDVCSVAASCLLLQLTSYV